MNSPFESREKSSFRRVFLLIVLAHIALASLPIAWLKFGSPAPISAGKPKLREEDVTWIDPALLAEQPKAEPEATPPPPPVVEAPPPTPKTSTVVHRVKETPRIAKTSFQKAKAPAPEHPKSPPRVAAPEKPPEPVAVAKTEVAKSTPLIAGPAIFDAAAEDAIQSYHAKIQKLMEQQWHQPAGITSDSAPTAKVAITVTRSGQIIDARLSSSSGINEVDHSSLEAVRSVGQIAPLPTAIQGDTYQLVIRFVLH